MPLFGPPNVKKLEVEGNIKGLIKALGYRKDSQVRYDAAFALGQIGDTCAVEPLIIALEDKSSKVREGVIKGLGLIGDPRAVEPLIKFLEDEFNPSLVEAVIALGKIGDIRAVKSLTTVLKHESRLKRGIAIKVLDQFNWKPEENEAGALYWIEKKELEMCELIGVPAVLPLIDILNNKYETRGDRVLAAEVLGKIGGPLAVESLITMLKDYNRFMREAAEKALTHLEDPKANQALSELKHWRDDYQIDGKTARYRFTETSLGYPMDIEVTTETVCAYCKYLRDPDLGFLGGKMGRGECSNYESDKSTVVLDDSCRFWRPNTKVRFWLSKGYMENNMDGWPRKHMYQVFDDGPDGEKGTH